MAGPRSDWLLTTINAVREVMVERLQKRSLDEETEREVQMALEEIEVMWEELLGQSELLTRETKRYQEFFENAPDAYAITDEHGALREANRSFAELLGMTRADLLGRPLAAYVDESAQPEFSKHLAGVVHPGAEAGSASWTTRLHGAGADPVSVQVTVRPIPLRKSAFAGLCWLFRRE